MRVVYVQLKITKKNARKYINLILKIVTALSRKVTGIAAGTECLWNGAKPAGHHTPFCLLVGTGSCIVHSAAQLPLCRGGKPCLSPRRWETNFYFLMRS